MQSEILEIDEVAAQATVALEEGLERARQITHDYDLLLHEAVKPSGAAAN